MDCLRSAFVKPTLISSTYLCTLSICSFRNFTVSTFFAAHFDFYYCQKYCLTASLQHAHPTDIGFYDSVLEFLASRGREYISVQRCFTAVLTKLSLTSPIGPGERERLAAGCGVGKSVVTWKVCLSAEEKPVLVC